MSKLKSKGRCKQVKVGKVAISESRPLVFTFVPGEVEVNKKGGKQSNLGMRLDLIDSKAMFRMGKVLQLGAERYSEQNWRKIGARDHINHALFHLLKYTESLDGEEEGLAESEDHLAHAMCRVMFAVATDK